MNRQSQYLILAVFIAGMTTMGIEMSASRLLGNVFGTSNLVWANIIGLILIYLSAGYFLGGRLADRSPKPFTFYALMAWAAMATAVVPAISRPVLLAAAAAVDLLDAAVVIGSFGAVLILFCVPVTLLGCVSPFAVRLAIRGADTAGGVAGRLYALSTLGSIAGTFLPVLLLIPAVGTARTFFLFAGLLLVVALIGLALSDARRSLRYAWMPVLFAALYVLSTSRPIKESTGQIYERESAYNYIQVIEKNGVRELHLNEGQGIHSWYDPDSLVTNGTWDYFVAAPFFNAAPYETASLQSVGIVGLAAGTAARQCTAVFGPVPITGYEIDPAILDVGRAYFDMNEPNLDARAEDGRWGLEHSGQRFSLVIVDAYRPPYIPPHLVTQEFFQMVYEHLADDGMLAINVASVPGDRRLIEALHTTVGSVFPTVFVLDVPGTLNSIVYAARGPASVEALRANRDRLAADPATHPFLNEMLAKATENLQPAPSAGPLFTDDWSSIEQITNAMIVQFVLDGNLGQLLP